MSQFPLAIPPEVSASCDAHHVAKLYCVCRFGYGRIPPTAGKARTSPPGKTTCERALEFYDIDFISELANLRHPLDVNEWREQKRFFVQAPVNTSDPLRTRSKDICSADDDRCRVCTIACSRKSIAVERSKSSKPSVGRPLEQSPQKDICNKCGQPRDDHDDAFCKLVMKGLKSMKAGEAFAERLEARGFHDRYVRRKLTEEFANESQPSTGSAATVVSTGVRLDNHHYLGLSPVSYRAPKKPKGSELCQILRREGISFPDGGLRQAVDEKWDVFGPLFACETLDLQEAAQANRITRLKFQLDGGQQFLKLSVNIATVEEGSVYVPSPNSVLENFLIGMGQAPVTSNNLKELFRYRSISTLFDMDIPKQVACDLKVAAMMVGIKMASSKYPCPFCLFTKGAVCTGIPPKPRRWEDHKLDLQLSRHSVISSL
ncbi:hypothetical protein FOL47_009557, partial [Perkinsus chesapeaki]